MKKIAVMLAMLSIGILNGMESESSYKILPKELKQEIVNTALATSNNVDEAINMIKKLGALHGVHYDTKAATDLFVKMLPNNLNEAIDEVKSLQGSTPEDFTKLVHILLGRFYGRPYKVAFLFNTPIAQEYLKLGEQLQEAVSYWKDNAKIKALIAQGADVNFYSNEGFSKKTPLNHAVGDRSIDTVKLLLAAGADPLLEDSKFKTAFDQVESSIKFYNKMESQGYPGTEKEIMTLKTIKTLLEEAVKKQQ
jgi:hypothetical protein